MQAFLILNSLAVDTYEYLYKYKIFIWIFFIVLWGSQTCVLIPLCYYRIFMLIDVYQKSSDLHINTALHLIKRNEQWQRKAALVCFCLFGVYLLTREIFTYMETSPLPVKGYKFWPMLGTHGHWAVRVL